MRPVFALVIAAFSAFPLGAQTAVPEALQPPVEEAGGADLTQFLWKNRLVIIFADSPGDPRFIEQMALIEARAGDLADRDVVVLTETTPGADPDKGSALREKFRPRGFMLMLIGKDGNMYLRKPRPWDVREISRSIDKMPIRREELRNR